jgi:integrase
MALSLYRRHRRECKAGHQEELHTSEFDERKKGWKRCECPIFASGTLSGKQRRQRTGAWEWDAARSIAAEWERAGSWSGIKPEPPTPSIPVSQPERITVERAVQIFLDERSEAVATGTHRKARYLLNAFKRFSDSKGYVVLDQWQTIDVREFRSSWKVAHNSAAKYMEIVKAFFEFSASNGWIASNPAKPIKGTKGKSGDNAKERIPFTDDEITRMFEACEKQYGKPPIKWARDVHHRPAFGDTARYQYRWTGQDLADFIAVSIYTGLRISDVATFHIDRLHDGGECHVRTTKTGRKVSTWIPEWLQNRIHARVADHGPLIFGTHSTKDINVITDLWRRKLNRLWELCGPWKEKPTPHRFRHTFARILLQKPGVTVRDVAELLGDTEEIVLRHYGAWVPERQARLTKILQEAFEGKPKLVEIPRRRR